MQTNYRNAVLSLSGPLSSLGMSYDEADRIFLDTFSLNIADYYKRVRMENAKHLLFFYHEIGIKYVAENIGYKNDKDFCADFYNEFKMSPYEFISLYHKKH